jgi:hypothetical protein
MEAADALAGSARPDEAAATLARLREAALADEEGARLAVEWVGVCEAVGRHNRQIAAFRVPSRFA